MDGQDGAVSVAVDVTVRHGRKIDVTLSHEQVKRCEETAMARGLTLSEWAAEVLLVAIGEDSRILQRVLVSAN